MWKRSVFTPPVLPELMRSPISVFRAVTTPSKGAYPLERLQSFELLNVCLIGFNNRLVGVVGAYGVVDVLLGNGVAPNHALVTVLGSLGKREVRFGGVEVAQRLLQLLIDFRSFNNGKQLAFFDV